MMKSTGVVLDDCFKAHDTGPGHPERPERLSAIAAAVADVLQNCRRIEPQPADLSLILSNHDEEYVDRLREHCRRGNTHIDCADSTISGQSFEVARLACGAVLSAVEAVAGGELQNAFCAVRPPGHHAERSQSMGFCLFNNIAIAARYLRQAYNLQRVLILDWDVHHGNGTQHSFEDDPGVFFCSLHGDPRTLYPGTGFAHERGRGPGEGTTLNIPMRPGGDDADYHDAFEEQVVPAIRAYCPEFVLISAGFDAHRADPLASINLETSSFEWLTRKTRALADELCSGQLVSILEGGYDLQALGESVRVHLQVLMER